MIIKSKGNGSAPHHLEDADLISHLDGELEAAEQDYARAHLEDCWHCRSRRQAIQNSVESFLRTRSQIMPAEFPPAGPAVAQFRHRLAQHRAAAVSFHLGHWLRSISPLRLRRGKDRQSLGLLWSLTQSWTYRKTAVASLVAVLALVLALLDPFKWNTVSADELLTRAGAYEFLKERPSGKVIRIKTQLDRINLTTRVEQNLGLLESNEDSLSNAVFVSQATSNGVIRTQAITDRDQPGSTVAFTSEFSAATATYLSEEGWLPHVSVALYKRLIAGRGQNSSEGASVTRDGSAYQIHHAFAPGHPSQIFETVLKLNGQNYAPLAVSILTVEGSGRFEYRLTRTAIESIDRTPEVARLFERPATEASAVARLGNATSKPEAAPYSATTSSKPEMAIAASADLEVEVLRLLHQAGADLGEQVSVTREENGPVRVNGIVQTDQRKVEILRALHDVNSNPAVHIDVKTVAEALAARSGPRDSSRATTVEGVEVAADTFPAYEDLRARMSDEEARVFAARMVSRSHSAMRHAWSLQRLMAQFSAKDLAAMQTEAHAKWIELVKSHARAFETESRGLREQLQPIFGAGSAGVTPADAAVTNDGELIRAVARLVSSASTNYEVVRSAFTVTRERATFTAIKSEQFWHSMRSAEAAAASISRAP